MIKKNFPHIRISPVLTIGPDGPVAQDDEPESQDGDRPYWPAADKLPDEGQYVVEVYGRSTGKNYKQHAWISWCTAHLEPWYIWRYHDIPDEKMRDRSAYQRHKHGVKALEGNGFYMREEGGS